MHVAIILKFGFFKGRLIILLYFVNLADGRSALIVCSIFIKTRSTQCAKNHALKNNQE